MDSYTYSKDAIPFLWIITSASLTANGGTNTQVLQLGTDSTFELTDISARTSLDAITDEQHPDNFTLFIRDTSTGREFMNAPVYRSLITNNIFSGKHSERRRLIFPVNNQFQFDFVNKDANYANIVTLALKGYKLFNTTMAG